MHDLDKAIRAAMMTAHRYARGGYAGGGGAESVLMQEMPSYDPMGNVNFPAVGTAPEQKPIAMENPERVRAAEDAARLAKEIQAFEASKAQIQTQPEWARMMTHAPQEPRAPVQIEGGFIGNRQLGTAPYPVANALSGMAQGVYDFKTAPLYAFGAGPLGTAIDTAEGVAAGSPSQVAMGAFGTPMKAVRNVIAPLTVASGLTAPDEAEAARAPRLGGLSAALSKTAPKAGEMSLEQAMNIAKSIPAAAKLPKLGEITGSMNPLHEVPLTYKGKSFTEWTPQEYQDVGRYFNVENLGPLSPLQTYKNAEGKEFSIPGGMEGKFTYYDLLHLKSQGIDPSKVDRPLHTEIQQKILRTMTPEELNNSQVWNGLVFGMTSPNNPLFPNQLSQSRLRLRDPKMLDDLSNMIHWAPGEKVSANVRKEANDKIANAFNLGAGSKGGLGTRGSADYTRVAELAKMFKQDPDFFRKTAGEDWPQFVERISSQVSGLSMKTGSFGSVWQDPAKAAISAIDRHMANEFEKTGGLFKDEAQRMVWEKRAVDRWNSGNPDRAVKNFYDLRRMPGADGHIGGMLLEYVGDAKTPKFRMAPKRGSGEIVGQINPDIPEHLRNAKWVYEPEKVFKMGEAYKRALNINDKIAKEHGLGLFGSQWMEWDRIRRRLEPHENMFPGLEKIPAPSTEQLRAVDMEHRLSGHKNYTKVDTEGRQLKNLTDDEKENLSGVYLQPTRPRPNPNRFGYFTAPPMAAGLGAASMQNRDESGDLP